MGASKVDLRCRGVGGIRPIDLARAAGISTQTVRGYERMGFIPPAERTPSGHRRYGERHLQALLASRAMIAGYGWLNARRIMRLIHGGEIGEAVRSVNQRHAELHAQRVEIEASLAALREVAWQEGDGGGGGTAGGETGAGRRRSRRIREAASLVGVEVSALRFWEQQGLLQPRRDPANAYRLYDAEQIRRLRVLVLLRRADYGLETVRPVLDEVAKGDPERAMALAEGRLRDLEEAAARCVEATAEFWRYRTEGCGREQ